MAASKKNDGLIFLPLGGAGEIGMNANLYGIGPEAKRRWILVDLGITFGNGTLPGVDVILPDIDFIIDRRDQLEAIVLTHAHEDHIGAVAYLWPLLECPIYATPFTASLLRRKLAEEGLEGEAKITVQPLGSRFQVGPFDLEYITLTHSIPEPNALAIRTKAGTALHTGDFKFDPTPVIGGTVDEAALARLGDEGVLAMICDSTNVFSEGETRSEAELLPSLTEVIGRQTKRVAVTCFASNVARLQTIVHAAQANGRRVALVGRSFGRIVAVARENGLLKDLPELVDERDIGYLPDNEQLIVCTGCQGEPRAALMRIATGENRHVTLGEGDTVIFSSRTIPGNELSVNRIHNLLARKGIEIITQKDALIHVSGHPAKGELARMYALVRPKISVPVHGEHRHMMEQAGLAQDWGAQYSIIIQDGQMISLTEDGPSVIDEVEVGRLILDGNRIVPIDGEIMRGRNRTIFNGSAVLTVVVDAKGRPIADIQVATQGLLEPDEEDEIGDDVAYSVAEAVAKLPAGARKDDEALTEAIRMAARRTFRDMLGKKPVTQVHLVRI